jgi:hypothetical protein
MDLDADPGDPEKYGFYESGCGSGSSTPVMRSKMFSCCRVLPFSWHEDTFMIADDPLGRGGPTVEQFLRHT